MGIFLKLQITKTIKSESSFRIPETTTLDTVYQTFSNDNLALSTHQINLIELPVNEPEII